MKFNRLSILVGLFTFLMLFFLVGCYPIEDPIEGLGNGRAAQAEIARWQGLATHYADAEMTQETLRQTVEAERWQAIAEATP